VMRRFFGKLFLVFVGITLALVGIEIFLRVQAYVVRSRQVREQVRTLRSRNRGECSGFSCLATQ